MRRASLLAVALLTCTLAGCGGTGGTGRSKAAADSTSPPTSSAALSPAASSPSTRPSQASKGTSSASASPSAGGSAPAPCRTADLRVTLGPGDGAAGSVYYPLRLTNTSSHRCSTGGFGGVSLVSAAAGQPIGAPADRTRSGTAQPLVLAPGQRAHATLRVVNAESYPPGTCHPTQATGLRVYPPNETHSAFVRHQSAACSSAKVHLLSLTPYKVG